jgi:hypothetical protein
MADQGTINSLNRDINEQRMAFNAARRQLLTDLKGSSDPEGLADQLISHAGEFGPDAAIIAFQATPADFGQAHAPADTSPLRLPLEAAHQHDKAMDKALAQREALIIEDDPNHQRVFQIFGRECTLDPENNRIRYLDTNETQHLDVIPVETGTPQASPDDDHDP